MQAEPRRPTTPEPRRPRPAPEDSSEPVSWGRWLADPRSAVLLTMGTLILVGGGRRLWIARRSRQAIDKLQSDNPAPADVAAAVEFGRDGLTDFFRIMGTAEDPASRDAAARAISRLWARNELVAEEEKALVRRGLRIDWIGRRKYPRALTQPIEFRVAVSAPFLGSDADDDDALERNSFLWRHRVAGTRRAALERDSDWMPIAEAGEISISVAPDDFASSGPHRLALQASVRTTGRAGDWTLELPHLPFTFEFDAHLDPAAVFASFDETRERWFAEHLKFVAEETEAPTFLDVSPDFVVRNPPGIRLDGPPPADLAHRVELEFEGVEERLPAGRFVVADRGPTARGPGTIATPELETKLAKNPVERAGEARVRARLTPDPQLAWANPEIRSLWPGSIVTDWAAVQVVRR